MLGTVAVKQTQFFALNGLTVRNQCAIGASGATVFVIRHISQLYSDK